MKLAQSLCPYCKQLYWHLESRKTPTCNGFECLFRHTFRRAPSAFERGSVVHPKETGQGKLAR